MEPHEIKSTSTERCEKASQQSNEILFNDVEYDRKFRALQAYLPFVDNLLLQSSGKIASDRLQSLKSMLKVTSTKMKYDVMEKCESVLQSLMKKMEAAKNIKSADSISRTSTAATTEVTQQMQRDSTTSTVTTKVPSVCKNSEKQHSDFEKKPVNQTNGHYEHQVKLSTVSKEICSTRTSESPCQSLNDELANKIIKLDPENRSMVRTLKLAAARTTRNSEAPEKVSKRVPITWDDTSTALSKKSEIDTLKLAAARAARFAEPPQIPDNQRGNPPKGSKVSAATLQKCSDISTLKLAAARTSKQMDYPPTGSDVNTDADQEGSNSLAMSRIKLKKMISPNSKVIGEEERSPPRFSSTKFDLDSPRNDWDFQAAPESSSHWNPSPPTEDPKSLSAIGNNASNAAAGHDQSQSRANNDKACTGSKQSSSSVGSYYSPIHGLVQRRISTGPDSPLSPDELGQNTAEAKRRLRDKLSQEIHMVHRVGTSKGGSLRGLAAKDGKVPPMSSKDDKKAGYDGTNRPGKMIEIDMFSNEVPSLDKNAVSEPAKEPPKVLKGLYAPRYKSSQENSSAKSGIVSSEQKPTSRSSVDANRTMKSPPGDSGLKKLAARAEKRPVTCIDKLPEADSIDAAGKHSRLLSTMTTEELERAVHMNVRNLPSPPAIPALVLDSRKEVSSIQPEKVILNPAFNSAPPLIEPGFFSKSDVDLRVQDPNAPYKTNSDIALQQTNIPQNLKNHNSEISYLSRFDRDTPISPDGTSPHDQDHEILPGPRHITYHLNNSDGWQDRNSSGGRSQNNIVERAPISLPPGESFHNQYPQHREAPWINGSHQQMPFVQRDLQLPHCEERHFQQPLRDQHAMQIPHGDERNRHLSGDNHDFRALQFHRRNFQQPMGNPSPLQIQNEHGRHPNQFSQGDNRFQGPNFFSGQNHRPIEDLRFMQASGRNMSNLQTDNSHGFHGSQFSGRNPMFDQRGTQDQGRMNQSLQGNYPGRNSCGPSFDSREQQIQHIQGRNINIQPLLRNPDFSMVNNQGQNPHPPMNEGHNQRLTPALATPQNFEVPSVQGPNRDPRNSQQRLRPETSKNDQFHWKNPSPSLPAVAPTPRQTHVSQPAPVPIPSPTGLDKDRPVQRPISPLSTATTNADQIPTNQDCIPFTPPRYLDPRTASKTPNLHTGPQFKGASNNVPPKETSSKSQKSQPPAASNRSRKQRNSWLESSQRRYNKDSSRRGSWEAEEARRRDEKRKSFEQNQSQKNHKDSSSLQKQGELVSPLNSLYGSPIIQKTGVGYGFQKFKIPKIKRPSPPKQVEPEVSAAVTSTVTVNPPVPELPVIVPAEPTSSQQPAEEKSGQDQKLSEPQSVEHTQLIQVPDEQQPVENSISEEKPATTKPNVEKPHVGPLSLPAPLIIEAFMQQSKIENVNQLLENIKLLGNLKPNQLKKFQNIFKDSSSDDSDADADSEARKKKDSKLKTSKNEELNKTAEDTEIKETVATGTAETDLLPERKSENEELIADVKEDEEIEIPTRKLRGRKPGPLSTKKKEHGTDSEAPEQSNDLDLAMEAAPKPRVVKTRRRNSLEILQADIKDMYISEGVLSASGRRICTMLKKEVSLTAAAKELPKKHPESAAECESDSQMSTSKKKTSPSNTKKRILKKTKERVAIASRRSGRYFKGVDRSTCSSDEEEASDGDEPVLKPAGVKALDSDGDVIKPTCDQDIAEDNEDSQSNMPKPRKRKVVKRRKNVGKKLSVPVTSSASDDDEEENPVPAKAVKGKKTQNKNSKSLDVDCGSTDKEKSIQERLEYDSSPVRKRKVEKAPRLCESSDSCVESVSQSVVSSTSNDNVELSEKPKSLASNKSVTSNNFIVNSSVNLSAYVKLQKMTAASLTPSPSFCSSDESSDVVPLTALVGPKSRQVARRGGRGRGPRSRHSQQVLSQVNSESSVIDSSISLGVFPKASASVGSDDAYLDKSISDIIDRLSKDDDDSKRVEVDDPPDEGSVGTKDSVPGTKGQKKKRRRNWSMGVIKKKRQVKSSSPEAVSFENTGKKVDTLLDRDIENAPESRAVPLEESRQTDSETVGSTQEEAEATAVCGDSESEKKSDLPSSNLNVDLEPLSTTDLLDVDTSNQVGVECHVDDKVVSCTKPIRNIDKEYYIVHNFKTRKYVCKLCPWKGKNIVSHYALTHPEDEVFISRLSKEAAEKCIEESLKEGYHSAEDLEDETEKPTKKRTHPFTCRMCFFKCTKSAQFYDHCCGHTGEYRYKCSQCSAVMAGKIGVSAHYQYRHRELKAIKEKYTELFPMPERKSNGVFAYICPLCNFVQMCKSNVTKHLEVNHAEECDTMKIVYFNMHVDLDKKRISLRTLSTSSSADAVPEETSDVDTKINCESANVNSVEVANEEETQIVDLAAFLPSDQEILSRTRKGFDPITKDLLDDSSSLTFASKIMPDDQNSLIDDLIRRTENLSESKDISALNQMDPAFSSGILDSQLSESFLTDELSQDSCPSDSTLTDDPPLCEKVVGASDLMDDIIKRLEVSTAAETSVNLNSSEQISRTITEEEITGLEQATFVGPFEVRKVSNTPIYSCNVDSCCFSSVNAESFINHLKHNHLKNTWDGMCQTCGNKVIIGDIVNLKAAFLHLLKDHLHSLGIECEKANQKVDLHDPMASRQEPLAFEISSNETPFSRLQTRPPSDDDEEDAMNMCVIENVVSLAPIKFDDTPHETSPLPPLIANLAENIEERSLGDNPSMAITNLPQLQKIKIPKSELKQEDFVCDGGNNSVERGTQVQQNALVQCLQAKTEKEPTAYEQMLERGKLRHLFKCMARSCSYSSNSALDFGRHGAEHEVDKYECCAYCMKKFPIDKNLELATHIQLEHGHCTFQCAYCFYRAICPSYVVVHQNFSHTNKSISILQCLGSVVADRPTPTLAEVVPKYVCAQSDCGETFLLTEQFILHLHESHTQIHNYSCHLCDTVCFDSRNFITHYRVHSLHLYQCRYCVHGTSNEESMHHHLCNFHPAHSPYAVMREAEASCSDKHVTFDDLKIIDLGKKTAVQDSLIVKLSMTEMAEEVEVGRLVIFEPMQSEGDESETEAMMIDTSNETESDVPPIRKATSPNVGIGSEKTPAKLSDEPICIDLDSGDDVACVELNSSADERALRALRSSPRKSTTEGETSAPRARPEKRAGPAKEEAAPKPRATTSFEFGAITLEDLNETGLSGEKLFRCGFSMCESACENLEELREHLMVCDHSRNSHGLVCPHCQRSLKNLMAFCDHMRSHSTCRYGCGLCLFRATAAKPVQAHLRSRHRITTTKCIPLNPLKADPENDLFVVGPLRPDKRKNHLVSQIQSPDKKSRPKYVYQPDEGHLLPIQAIYPFIVTCATCSFTTKVRKNMERHLTLHKTDFLVPSQNPVNAVPCLETKEMMFDKMTNLAASSNLKVPDATNLYLTPEDVARLPKFVPEQQRYRCGVQNCTYNSCDENMLIHHLRALHRDEDYYNCPHCLPAEPEDDNGATVSRILIDKLSLHLKMHDSRLYKCGYCFYYDHRKHIVERHVTDKHTDYKVHVNVVREPFSEGTPVVSAKAVEKETAKELTPRYAWKCSRCDFESVTRPEMVNHSDAEHGKKLQYECGLCHNRFQSKQSFDQHCGFKHPGLKEQLLFNYFKVENAAAAVVEAAFDTRPLWSRNSNMVKHIRGIYFDDESTETPKDLPESEAPTLPAEETRSKEAMFLCSICKTFETKVKADMKIHLYKELKYFRYQCTICDKKVFSLTAGKKHMLRAHSSTDSSSALTLFEKDLETEQKVEEILAAQENLMQLDIPAKPTKAARSHKKSTAVRVKEVPVSPAKEVEECASSSTRALDESNDVDDSDLSVGVEDSYDDVASQRKELTKTFECKECGQLFHSVRGLKVHIRLSHLSQGKWKCNTCELTHTSRNYVKNHCKSAHPNSTIDPPYAINTQQSVPAGSQTVNYWQTVWGIHPKSNKNSVVNKTSVVEEPDEPAEPGQDFRCTLCQVGFVSIRQLNRHKKRHLEKKPYLCGHCGFEAVSEEIVRSHSKEVHLQLQPLIEMQDVPKKSGVSPVRSRQKRKQTLKTKEPYDLYDKVAPPSPKQPRLEMEIIELDSDDGDDNVPVNTLAPVNGPTPVSRAPVPKSTSHPVSVSPPMNSLEPAMLGLEHFKCFYCSFRANTRELVHKHWLQEHKDPRFVENGDFYPFTGVTFLIQTIANVLLEFTCEKCEKKFDSRSLLYSHIESEHPNLCDIECPKCDFKTPCANTMGAHLHVHRFEFKCTLCEDSYLDKTDAERHWQFAHKNEPFKADSFVLNLDPYKSLKAVSNPSAQIVKHSNVAKKSTTKMPRTGDFYARKSTGNAPWRRGTPIYSRKAKPPAIDLSNLSISVPIGHSKVDMRVDTYANMHNIDPKVRLIK